MIKKSVFSSTKWSIKKSKLAVLIPCRDMCHSAHAFALIELVKLNCMNGIDTHVAMDASTILLNQRERLAEEAIKIGAEYILWLDSDMVIPSSTAMRLLAHGTPVVTANYVKRQSPYKGVAYEKIGEWENPLEYKPCDKLVEIEGIGMGCFLMQTKILSEIPKPWFEFTWDPLSQDWLGEDINFCKKIINAGYKIYVDTQLSMETLHMGTYAFNADLLK